MDSVIKFLKCCVRKSPSQEPRVANAANMTSQEAKKAKWSPGPPVFAVVSAGSCQFTPEFKTVALKKKEQISEDTIVFTFATPEADKPLNLPTCACILAKFMPATEKDEAGNDKPVEAVVRPYTPMSTNDLIGEFQLMVKIYPDGKMTQHLSKLEVGGTLDFKHIDFNVKIQYPFGKKFIGMIVGGTGITPMIQALHALLGNKDDETQIGLLYGSRTSDNILGKETLDEWSKLSNRLEITYVLSNEPEDSTWEGPRGFITKELIQKAFPEPSADMMVFVCGPPPMYNAFCGPREDKENITGILGDLKYTKDHVYKF